MEREDQFRKKSIYMEVNFFDVSERSFEILLFEKKNE